MRYFHGTINLGLRYIVEDVRMHVYVDADWVKNVIDRKSTSRCCFSLGSTMISWMRRKQNFVALSTAEEKYIFVSMDSCEAAWLRKLFGEVFE